MRRIIIQRFIHVLRQGTWLKFCILREDKKMTWKLYLASFCILRHAAWKFIGIIATLINYWNVRSRILTVVNFTIFYSRAKLVFYFTLQISDSNLERFSTPTKYQKHSNKFQYLQRYPSTCNWSMLNIIPNRLIYPFVYNVGSNLTRNSFRGIQSCTYWPRLLGCIWTQNTYNWLPRLYNVTLRNSVFCLLPQKRTCNLDKHSLHKWCMMWL